MRSCLINRIDKTILKRFMLVSFCFLPFSSAFSTHHFTVSNETIITSCVSQVVFLISLLFFYVQPERRSKCFALVPSLSIFYFRCIGFMKLKVRADINYSLTTTTYLSPILHKNYMASIIFTYTWSTTLIISSIWLFFILQVVL